MEILAVLLVAILFLISFFNFLSARTLKKTNMRIHSSVSILIPMRNEARNVEAVLSSALTQSDIDQLEVMALDDSSSDQTGELIAGVRDLRLKSVRGGGLPSGWLGKNFALHTLAKQSEAEYLVFLDADVRLESNAVASAIALMNERGWDYISPYPRQIATGVLARIVQPLLQWSWFATLPLRLVENSRLTSTVVANGQFFIVKNSSYKKSGGHEVIKGEVLDDLELARALRRSGSRGSVVDASALSSCEMYRSYSELISGYSKSQWRAYGGTLGALIVIALMFVSAIYPLFFLVDFELWALSAYLGLVFSRVMVALRTRSSILSAPLHPIAIAIWIYLIFRSLLFKRMGRLVWRGRAI